MNKNVSFTAIIDSDRVSLNSGKPFYEFELKFLPRKGEIIYYEGRHYHVEDIIHFIIHNRVEVIVIPHEIKTT